MKPRKDIPMTESEKEGLEDYIEQVSKCDNKALLNHLVGAVRTHETNEDNMEYFRVVIGKLFDKVLERMKPQE